MKQLDRDLLWTQGAERGRVSQGASGAGEAIQAVCVGCRERRDDACAACGARASIWTEAGDGRHAVAWCARCHAILLSGRPENAAPLEYLPAPQPVAVA